MEHGKILFGEATFSEVNPAANFFAEMLPQFPYIARFHLRKTNFYTCARQDAGENQVSTWAKVTRHWWRRTRVRTKHRSEAKEQEGQAKREAEKPFAVAWTVGGPLFSAYWRRLRHSISTVPHAAVRRAARSMYFQIPYVRAHV